MGKTVILPLMNREIPIVADSYVDMEFGTGMVKVTPAHDPNDFEIGRRHNLPSIEVIGSDAHMTEAAGPYQGLERYECRKKVVEDLKKEGFLVKEEEHHHAVGECYRCGTVVEPLVSKQWFVKMDKLAERARKVVEEGQIRFVPERFTNSICTGWRIFAIGVSPDSCGGVTVFQSGTARTAVHPLLHARIRQNALNVVLLTLNRIQTFWILGSRRLCGLSRPWDGLTRLLI